MVEGEAVVTLGDQKIAKKAGENVFIPLQAKHRIQNDTESKLEFIEVQYGDNLDENDIIRYEDLYGRQAAGQPGSAWRHNFSGC